MYPHTKNISAAYQSIVQTALCLWRVWRGLQLGEMKRKVLSEALTEGCYTGCWEEGVGVIQSLDWGQLCWVLGGRCWVNPVGRKVLTEALTNMTAVVGVGRKFWVKPWLGVGRKVLGEAFTDDCCWVLRGRFWLKPWLTTAVLSAGRKVVARTGEPKQIGMLDNEQE